MRKVLAAFVLCLALGVGGCSAVDKAAISNLEKTHNIVLPDYTQYVDKDSALTPEQKDDRKKLIESLRRLVQALKDSAGVK